MIKLENKHDLINLNVNSFSFFRIDETSSDLKASSTGPTLTTTTTKATNVEATEVGNGSRSKRKTFQMKLNTKCRHYCNINNNNINTSNVIQVSSQYQVNLDNLVVKGKYVTKPITFSTNSVNEAFQF
jgi:hypothetical protein